MIFATLAIELLYLLEGAVRGNGSPSRFFECASAAICTLAPECRAPNPNPNPNLNPNPNQVRFRRAVHIGPRVSRA